MQELVDLSQPDFSTAGQSRHTLLLPISTFVEPCAASEVDLLQSTTSSHWHRSLSPRLSNDKMQSLAFVLSDIDVQVLIATVGRNQESGWLQPDILSVMSQHEPKTSFDLLEFVVVHIHEVEGLLSMQMYGCPIFHFHFREQHHMEQQQAGMN